ncbi:hypothetical protein [Ideonella sp.]|uniref:hypothetical protein n=1 Tax=Ideonella sp. TaxID=1929293 RepID=UPI0035B25BDF
MKRAMLITAMALQAGACAAADAPNSSTPIHLHTIGTGDVEGLKNGIRTGVEACRATKKLPPGPIKLPSDAYLAKLALIESDEYFDGARHAKFQTQRLVWPDPRSGSCELKLFHHRHAQVGDICDSGTSGHTTLLGDLVDMEHPAAPRVEVSAESNRRTECSRRRQAYDLEGVPREDAGQGVQCVWHSDVIANAIRKLGRPAKGHDPNAAVDFCLYAKQPVYVFNGRHETVVLKSNGPTKNDAMDRLMGVNTAYFNHKLVDFSDGQPIPAERFDPRTLRAFVEQPAITAVADSP